ncbi:MAG: hypothetical protein K1X72_25170 [Pyrinomonadaceae bacterium]|nr:hypothetical protein [Pyrinomonadaceae bacterium]
MYFDFLRRLIFIFFILLVVAFFISSGKLAFAQQPFQNNFVINQPNNYMANSTVFRQEIARMEINVVRAGKAPLPINQVPRLEKDDILKVRLIDEAVNSLKPDQSNFDWTFLVAYINPGRNDDSNKTVSEEINFKKRGWYKEYSFLVPYDCQPIFFLYPKPQYRSKILNLINKNQEDIKKIGEKTLEIADAYAQIGMFLNELQGVVYRNYYRNLYNNYPNYNGIYPNNGINNFGQNDTFLAEQAIERIAKSFNIQLPNCWGNNQFGGYYNPTPYNNGYYNNGYNNGYYNNGYNNYGYYGGNDFMGRVQCVARTVRVEDFDISVGRMLQQGGIFAAAQLAQKYPQIAFWINIAAAALDFIVKITNKAPLRIVPTVATPVENGIPNGATDTPSTKISLYAETQPNDNGFVTAYPMVFHKWQATADPNLITLPMPILMDSCLHAGQNIIRTADIVNDWMTDNFTKDFQLTLSSSSGFQKDFPLKKNVGFGGWELSLTKEDLNLIPKIDIKLEGKIVGKRGFNKIQSPTFSIQLTPIGSWNIEPNSQKTFTVGGKRVVTLRNQTGNCRCLESIIYKPSFGGEFVFDAKRLMYSSDGKDVSFEIDTANFPSGGGQLELHQYGGETASLNLNLYPLPPTIAAVKVSKGDTQVTINGERLEQVQAVKVNGKRAVYKGEFGNGYMNGIPGASLPSAANSSVMYSNTLVFSEKTYVFEDSSQWQDTNSVTLELELGDQRNMLLQNIFAVSPARPTILANEGKEIEAFAVNRQINTVKSPDSLGNLPIFPVETAEIGLNIQNALTDFDFKVENLRIETRIENTQTNPFQPNDVNFEVLDWRSIRLDIRLNDQAKKMLGGRRIQFRICDKARGNSDWYSIKQTFVRLPQGLSLKCLNKQCELSGKGVNYIQQVSLDDGKTWFPQDATGLVSQTNASGMESAIIPNIIETKKALKIRLRDFPKTDGLPISLSPVANH